MPLHVCMAWEPTQGGQSSWSQLAVERRKAGKDWAQVGQIPATSPETEAEDRLQEARAAEKQGAEGPSQEEHSPLLSGHWP